jgi:hypothetical protein
MKPVITEGVGSYLLKWEDGVSIDVSRARQHQSDGRVTGEVAVRFGDNGKADLLHRAQFNFSSTQSRNTLAKALKERVGDVAWGDALEQMCFYVVDWVRRGEPVVELWGECEAESPEYLIEPLVIKGYPNIIFGDPGSFKSSIASLLIAIITLPWKDNPLGLPTPDHPTTSLYLDWETDRPTVNWTLSRLFRGHHLPAFPMKYRRCAAPLPQDTEALKELIDECKAELVVIDSLGMASGGDDLNKSGSAIGFYTELRKLNVTSLILAHNSKDRETKTRSIIGHQYYTAQARNIWEAKKIQETGEDEIDLGLFHRKAPPFAKLSSPIGAHVTFTKDSMLLRAQPIATAREFVSELGIKAQIRDTISDGAMMVKDIAQSIGANENQTRTTLNRMRDRGMVVKLPDGRWGLASKDYQ